MLSPFNFFSSSLFLTPVDMYARDGPVADNVNVSNQDQVLFHKFITGLIVLCGRDVVKLQNHAGVRLQERLVSTGQ